MEGLTRLADLMSAQDRRGEQQIAIGLIDPDPTQPRQRWSEAGLESLVDSIRAQGVVQPVVLRAHPDRAGRYILVAGERRWRASLLAGVERIPAVIRALTESQTLALQLVENLDREDLDILDEAQAVARLAAMPLKGREVAQLLGKTEGWVSIRRKIAAGVEVLRPFVEDDRTRDPETLTLLLELDRQDRARCEAFLDPQKSLNRRAVRDAIAAVRVTPGPAATESSRPVSKDPGTSEDALEGDLTARPAAPDETMPEAPPAPAAAMRDSLRVDLEAFFGCPVRITPGMPCQVTLQLADEDALAALVDRLRAGAAVH